MVIMLNICLCLDLILTFRSPFKKPESRYPMYWVVSSLISLVPAIIRVYCMKQYQNEYLYGWIICDTFLVYLVIAIWSIYYAFKHLSRPGMSSTARGMITRRHISYIVVNILCQTYNIMSKVTTNVNPHRSFQGYILTPLIVLYFGQGVWLNLVRLAEPTFLPTAAFYTKKFCCSRWEGKKACQKKARIDTAWATLDEEVAHCVKPKQKTSSVFSEILESAEFIGDCSSEDECPLEIASQRANLMRIEELKKDVIKQEAELTMVDKDKEMTPLMLFLSSSLNVELVYTILFGIGKFTLLNFMRNSFNTTQSGQFKAMEYRVDQFGDTTITIRQIRINGIERWNSMSPDETKALDKGH